eukprot:scaffold203360_cov36-Tisochrysis_lutea.AAC.3
MARKDSKEQPAACAASARGLCTACPCRSSRRRFILESERARPPLPRRSHTAATTLTAFPRARVNK